MSIICQFHPAAILCICSVACIFPLLYLLSSLQQHQWLRRKFTSVSAAAGLLSCVLYQASVNILFTDISKTARVAVSLVSISV